MATRSFSDFEKARKPKLHLVVAEKQSAELLAFDSPTEAFASDRKNLGCARGVAWALAIQGVFVVVIIGLWELVRALR